MIAVKPETYLYPPRATDAVAFSDTAILGDFGYLAQPKFNDSRCLVKCLNGDIQLWNRHGAQFRDYTAPTSLIEQLRTVPPLLGLNPNEYHLFDGGLLDKKHSFIKDTVVLWDILIADGQYLLNTTYRSRYERLWLACTGPDRYFQAGPNRMLVGKDLTDDVFVPIMIEYNKWSTTWEQLRLLNSAFAVNSPLIEGLYFKAPDGRLEPGFSQINNSSWQARSRVTTGRHKF